MTDESAPETKNVMFRIRMTRPPEFTITYKDKDDLFEAFKKNMAALGVSVNKVLWIDEERELIQMNNADAVMKATEDCCLPQKLHVIDDADKQESSSSCCDEFADHRRGCCSTDHNPAGHPHPSDRSRGHRRPAGRSPHHHHHHHHRPHRQNPAPACVPCSCSTWCPTMGTGCGCGCSHGY